jgi:hypothetical protein
VTLHATRQGENVTVHCTYGPIVTAISEHHSDVRQFHAQLGDLLDAAEEEHVQGHVRAGQPMAAPATSSEVIRPHAGPNVYQHPYTTTTSVASGAHATRTPTPP